MDPKTRARMDRRGFLRLAGLGLGGLLFPNSSNVLAARGSDTDAGDVAILYDASLCIGCRQCQEACHTANGLPCASPMPETLSSTNWNVIVQRSGVSREDHPFFFKQCMHCTDAACVAVCPTGALKQDEHGFVSLEPDLCNGCGYCSQFCPFGVPQLGDVNLATGAAVASKCTFCSETVCAGNGGPACVEACPTGALMWGSRQDLIDRARERVSHLTDQGWGAVHIYGLEEAGGLHRLSILLDDPRAYGLPLNPDTAFDFSGVWQRAIQPLGGLAVAATAAGLGLNWLVARSQIKVEER